MLTILSLLLATTTTPPCATGRWITTAGDRPVFALIIADSPKGPSATWERPTRFEADAESFSNVRGPAIRRTAHSVRRDGETLELTFDDSRPGASPDVFRVRCTTPGRLSVTLDGAEVEPFDFVKAPAQAAALGGWDATRTYVRTIDRATNAEMTRIFTADQADRSKTDADWRAIGAADTLRRQRTQALLDAGQLNSGDDFYHAAFVFQHGDTANDYLKAHILATIAAARGKPAAVWIAAATLDRYLQAIGQPQVLGTQFKIPNNAPATQEPYNRTLVSDALRKALRVPPLAEQEKQRIEYSTPPPTTTP